MVEGMGRNNQLNISALSLGTLVGNGSLGAEIVQRDLFLAATANGHVAKHGIAQTQATIESGLNAGAKKPRPLLTSSVPDIDISAMIANGIAAYQRKHPAATKNGKRRINLVRMDSIEEEAITWLWEGFLPKATLTLLGGAIQAGKSTIAMVWPQP